MKKQNHQIVVFWISLCILVSSVGTYAEENKVIILHKKTQQKLTKDELAKLKDLSKSEDIPIVQEYSAAGSPNYICPQASVIMGGFLPLWMICTVVDYSCPSGITLTIETEEGVPNITCNYNCPSSSATSTCECPLNEGSSVLCPP